MRAVTLWTCAASPVVWAAVVSRPHRLSAVEAVACLVVLAAAVRLVRRRPATVLLLITATWQVVFFSRAQRDSTLAVAVLAAGLVALSFLAGRHATTGHRGVAALLCGLTAAVTGGLVVGGTDTAVASLVAVLVLAVVPWAVGRYRRRYAEMVRAGWDRAEHLEREAERAVEQAGARERARLAAEMHDLVGHELARAALRVGALEVAPTLPAEHRAAAREARAGVTAAAERLADAVRLLRPEEDEPVEPVETVVERARRSGLPVDLVVQEAGAAQLDPVIARTVHRVVTESITNAVKHAPGAPVAISLTGAGDGLDLRVVNEAARSAATAAPGSGRGLLGLGERVALVGGRFDARPRLGGGFEVVAHLPSRPVTTIAPGTPTTRTHRESTERRVRDSARRTVLVAAATCAGVVLSVLGHLVVDAATSVLSPVHYAGLHVGQGEADVGAVLPGRTRVDDPDGEPPPRDGWTCRYYSTHWNPFGQRGRDLHRLCFQDGRLVDKTLITRDP
ncbi:sensor histidine kinase [Umezawaea beigongshangensis]|uniref:sensor histidine kinase n=1 Tax=Umezawaea beigongshangensis TaxID=2780383 RepID=UPI0018F20EA5|nr:histidine kinase [Umezawaea beigongshangensis]